MAEITLTFSETVDILSFDPTGLTLQNLESSPSSSFTLTGGNISTSSGPVLKVSMTASDINRISGISNLATSVNDVYLSITRETIRDTSNNRVRLIPTSAALQAYAFNLDVANPSLLAFDLDLNSGRIFLSFDEFVNISTLQVSELTLQDGFLALAANFSLTTARSTQIQGRVVTISLSDSDLNAVKLLPLCTGSSDCFLTFSNDTISDAVGLPLIGRSDGNGLRVSTYIRDSTPPELISFTTLNLETGIISLSFSEAINVTSVQPEEIRLQTLFEMPLQAYNLTGGSLQVNSDSTVLYINLNAQDLNVIKRDPRLCTTRATCYFVATSELLQDTSNNNLVAIEEQFPGYIVGDIIEDELGPIVNSFDFDLDRGLLTLHFNEPIDSDTLTVTAITIQSAENATEAESMYLLTGGEVLTGNIEDVLIQLTTNDVNNLKLSNATKDENSTYISVPSGFVTDTAYTPNPAQAIPQSSAQQVANYTPDASPPQLLGYSINLRTEVISLTFDEPVLVDFFNASGLLLHSEAMQSGNLLRLSDGEVLNTEYAATVITVALSMEDIAAVKLDGNFGTSLVNTYLSVEAGNILDIAFNPIEAVEDRMISTIEEATGVTFASLSQYTLDLNTGHLLLTFTDVMNVSTLYPSAIRLQSKQTATASEVYTLTSGSQSSTPNGHIVNITLSALDVLGINSIPGLAKNTSTTYLIMRADFIDDYQGNDVLPITDGKALQVASFIPDTSAPEIREVLLDLDGGVLNLTFSDTVSLSSLVLSNIAIQNERNATNNTISLPLSGGLADISLDTRTVTIALNS